MELRAGTQSEIVARLHADTSDAAIAAVMAPIRRFLNVDAVVFVALAEQLEGWTIESFQSDSLPNPSRFKRCLCKVLEDASELPAWLDLRRHGKGRINTASRVDAFVPRVEYERSAFYTQAVVPSGLGRCLLGMLLSDGDLPLGWIGGFNHHAIADQQLSRLSALGPSLQLRLKLQNAVAHEERYRAALVLALEQIGAPAILADAHGRIFETNALGREQLDTNRDEVEASIGALLARRRPSLPFTLTRLPNGLSSHYLAVLRPRSPEARVELAVAIAARRWRLTRRQHEVLERVARGDSNVEIATALSISVRATEMHVSALFERAEVDNRVGLVAAVLLA